MTLCCDLLLMQRLCDGMAECRKYILIDEFQILIALQLDSREILPTDNAKSFAVGDDDQKGADLTGSQIMLDFLNSIGRMSGSTCVLIIVSTGNSCASLKGCVKSSNRHVMLYNDALHRYCAASSSLYQR